MNVLCTADICPVILNSTCVFYTGNTLTYTGITTNDSMQTALQKIDAKFGDATIGYVFTNGLYQPMGGTPVGLGGNLIANTSIGGNFTLTFAGNLQATKHITTGGTASQFVKGDGTLDSTAYQAAGNYITALSGDVIASGPGVASAALAVVNTNPGTFGSATLVPRITVDNKGRVTDVTTTAINVPSGILSFVGDVYGSGVTGSDTTLTLSNVNLNVYTNNTFLKFKVNAKGLVTGAAPVTHVDLEAVFGYVPVPNTRTITINGITQNLQSNITFTLPGGGTVQNVSVTPGVGISASVTNPSTVPNISITNTAPDQVVSIGAGAGINVTGTYPNFTVATTGGNYITSLTGEASATGPGAAAVTLSTPAVTGKLLTGVNITGGTVVATDTILQGFGKLQNQINSLIGGSIYQGTWNAATNTPTLTSGVGTDGYYYITSVYGTTNLDGIAEWHVGDWAIFHGGVWQKVDNTDAVVSVNGYTGAVSLVSSDISEGLTNLYYTPARARTAISITTTGTSGAATYDNLTGVLNIPNYNPDLSGYVPTSRTLTINGTAFNLSADRSWSVGTVTSVAQLTLGTTGTDLSSSVATGTTTPVITLNVPTASATNRGALSSTDWSTFNSKQAALSGTGFVKVSGTTVSYDNSTYLTTSSASSTYVRYTGSTSDLDMGTNFVRAWGFTANGFPAINVSGTIDLRQNGGNYLGGQGAAVISSRSANTLYFTFGDTNLKAVVLENSLLTDHRTFSFPDATGTFALTSNLSSYVPYTGATGPVNLGAYDLTVNSIQVGRGGGNIADNTRLGNLALGSNTTGTSNTAVGNLSLYSNTTGGSNSSFGVFSLLSNTTGTSNTSFGSSALYTNTTGNQNTAVGVNTLQNNTTGGANTGTGVQALKANTTGIYNTASGANSLGANTTGNYNTALGNNSLLSNTTGSQNTGIGNNAGLNLTTGNNNTLVGGYWGVAGMANNVVLSDGAGNIRFQYNGTNTLLGQSGNVGINTTSPTAKLHVAGASSAVLIGESGGVAYITGTNAAGTSSQELSLRGFPLTFTGNGGGGGEHMRITSGGEVLIGTTSDAGDYKLQVNGRILATDSIYSNGDVVAYASSDIRLKDNILPIKNALEKVKKIGGYTFDWNNKQTTYEGHDVGVIAQEIEAVLPEVVTTRDNGYKAVKYEKLTALLIESIKEQQVQIERLELLINKLTK